MILPLILEILVGWNDILELLLEMILLEILLEFLEMQEILGMLGPIRKTRNATITIRNDTFRNTRNARNTRNGSICFEQYYKC